jgi:predicted outer membrane protein
MGCGIAMVGLLLAGPALVRAAHLSDDDKTFVIKAKHESEAQIDLAGMAVNKSTLHELKDEAEHVVADHRVMDKDLDDLISHYGVTLTDDETISADKEHAKLEQLQGHDFDVEFVREELSRHERMLDTYKHAEENATAPDVKEYARRYAETIRKHLEKFKELQAKIG